MVKKGKAYAATATEVINGRVKCPKCNGRFWLGGSGAVCTQCDYRISVDREEMERSLTTKNSVLEMLERGLNALDDLSGTDVTCAYSDGKETLHIQMNDGTSFELTINQCNKTLPWNKARYNQRLQEIQDTLEEDEDCLRDIARDLLSGEPGLEKYIREELEDSKPLQRLISDLS